MADGIWAEDFDVPRNEPFRHGKPELAPTFDRRIIRIISPTIVSTEHARQQDTRIIHHHLQDITLVHSPWSEGVPELRLELPQAFGLDLLV